MAETKKRTSIITFLEGCSLDIIFVQETHCVEIPEWGGTSSMSFGTNRSGGCGFLVRKGFNGTITPVLSDVNGRYCAIDVDVGSPCRLICIYAPNNPVERQAFFKDCITSCFLTDLPIVFAGDFNCVDSLELDTLNHSFFSRCTSGSEELSGICSAFRLVDSWRVDNPKTKLYTWQNKSGSQASRIDRFYVDAGLSFTCSDFSYFPYSDHKIVTGMLKITTTKKSTAGKSFWKLNTTVLNDKKYQEEICSLISETSTLKMLYPNISEWWDDLKCRIKKISISYCCRKRARERAEKHGLHSMLEALALAQGGDLRLHSDEINEIKDQLQRISERENEGLAIRARVRKELLDEKCTKYFFSRIRGKRKRDHVDTILDSQGQIVTNESRILEVFRNFYQSLYTQADVSVTDQNKILDQSILPAAGEAQADVCTPGLPAAWEKDVQNDVGVACVNSNDIKKSLLRMKSGKTPGPDGLPAEFYKKFWAELAPHFEHVFEEIFNDGIMPNSMNDAVTILLQKEGDPLNVANKRPISLLNVDYKLFAKYLNEFHFVQVLQDNVSIDQTCAVKGRSIHDSLLLTRDVIDYSKGREGGCLVSLDQRKAFDMVDHGFLFRLLHKMGVNSRLIDVVKLMYRGINTKIQVNGALTERVDITRGVRQGCPLSPTLYVLYVQASINYLNSAAGIRGLALPSSEARIRVSAYADDLLLFCNHHSDVVKVNEYFALLRRATGSCINEAKTKCLNLQSEAPAVHHQTDELKVLGVLFSNKGYEHDCIRNMQMVKARVVTKISKWEKLDLSIPGKVLLLNSSVAPLLYHLSGVFLLKNKHIEEIRKLFYSFVWGAGKREVVARNTIETDKSAGGMGLVRLKERCSSFYTYHNLMRPLAHGFNHHRGCLFRYNAGFSMRKLYPSSYVLSEPHCFVLNPAYKTAKVVLDEIAGKLECIAPFIVGPGQLYKWLVGEQAIVKLKLPRIGGSAIDQKEWCEHVYASLSDFRVGARNFDFLWRAGHGALKTGEFVRRYKIPGTKIDCVFCQNSLETVEHLFSECTKLETARAQLLNRCVEIGAEVERTDRLPLLCLGVGYARWKRDVRVEVMNLVGEVNRAVWSVRNELLFGTLAEGVRKAENKVSAICRRPSTVMAAAEGLEVGNIVTV